MLHFLFLYFILAKITTKVKIDPEIDLNKKKIAVLDFRPDVMKLFSCPKSYFVLRVSAPPSMISKTVSVCRIFPRSLKYNYVYEVCSENQPTKSLISDNKHCNTSK